MTHRHSLIVRCGKPHRPEFDRGSKIGGCTFCWENSDSEDAPKIQYRKPSRSLTDPRPSVSTRPPRESDGVKTVKPPTRLRTSLCEIQRSLVRFSTIDLSMRFFGLLLAWFTGFAAYPITAAESTKSVLHFDGNGSYLELPPHILDGYQAITVEAWVRPEKLGFYTRFFEFGWQKDFIAACWNGCFNIQGTYQDLIHESFAIGFLSRYENNGWIHLAVVADTHGVHGYINAEKFFESSPLGYIHPAGNGNRYYFGKSTFGGGGRRLCRSNGWNPDLG